MEKYAVVVLASSDIPEGRGRMVHALRTTHELQKAGKDVEMYFTGIGVTWLQVFHEREHPFAQNYGAMFDAIHPTIKGACNFCTTGRFKVGEHVEALNIPLVQGNDSPHFSEASLMLDGYQVITF